MPFFSIITPLFNKETYFNETLASVRRQSHADWEWIVVDDGSTDGSLEIARMAAEQDCRIVVFAQANAGPCTARNRGAAQANGEWLLFLDADDLLEPTCLADWADVIRAKPGFTIHAGGWLEMEPTGGRVVANHAPVGYGVADADAVLRNTAIAFAPWHPTAAVVRRDAVAGDCHWDEAMNRMVTEDTVFWWRLIARHRVAVHSHCGVRYRRGTPGCRDQFSNPVKWSQGMFYALGSNVDFWKSMGRDLTPGQIGNLIRVYGGFGREAEAAHACDIAAEAYRRADELLATGRWTGVAADIRRLLGTRRFERWRATAKRWL